MCDTVYSVNATHGCKAVSLSPRHGEGVRNLTKAPSLKGLMSSGKYTKRSQETCLLLSVVAGRVYVTVDKHLDGFFILYSENTLCLLIILQ